MLVSRGGRPTHDFVFKATVYSVSMLVSRGGRPTRMAIGRLNHGWTEEFQCS
jgi:hypothetical protein